MSAPRIVLDAVALADLPGLVELQAARISELEARFARLEAAQSISTDDLIPLVDAAALVPCKVGTLRKWVERKKVRAVRSGHAVLVRRSDLEALR